MAQKVNPVEKARKVREYNCLKIVESLISGDKKTANKYIKKLVEKRLSNKINFVLNSENLI